MQLSELMQLLSEREGTRLEVCLVSLPFLLLHNPLPKPNLLMPVPPHYTPSLAQVVFGMEGF